MSTTRMVTIICWIISALVLVGLLIWFLTGSIFSTWSGGFNMNFFGINIGGIENLTGTFNSQGVYSEDISNIHSIEIDWVSGEITVIPHDGTQIQVTEFAQRDLRENERLRLRTDGGVLSVAFRDSSSFRGRMPRKNLEVLVPRELSDNLTKLAINTTSGRINTEDFNASATKISSISANMTVTNISSVNIDINTTSGDLTLKASKADKITISSVSGAIDVTETTSPVFDSSTTSGRINLSGDINDIDINTVSGNTTIKNLTIPERINVSTVSGTTDIYLPDEGEISITHSAVSGKFSSEIPVIMRSGAAFNFSSVSGNTTIHAVG